MTRTGALQSFALARVVEQDAAHQLRRHTVELRPVLPPDVLIDQLEIGLVDEGRRLQQMPRTLTFEVPARGLMQLRVDDGNERFKRLPVAIAPRDQELRDVPRPFGHTPRSLLRHLSR